ncbi:hypothetical protein [Fischerella sp. PCC 9605]|uniref:hypothetical protein n=1 Tax=Fischerella sp. PCC 9605 TaxID=1173024 RepID=UPI000478A79E|nr:hypothetical protein [Fischerella sp. PCC 9605]
MDVQKLMSVSLDDFDEITSKEDFSRKVGVSRQHTFTFARLAFCNLEDFAQHYPVLDEKVITNRGMDRYQCWVLIQLILAGIKTSRAHVESSLKYDAAFREKFSYKRFIETTQNMRVSA